MFGTDLDDIFAPQGPLAKQSDRYRMREAQRALAHDIARTIENRGSLIAEAGTGIGKTWAYLVPAMMAGGKVLISTGTRTLQDQLYSKDFPQVRASLNVPIVTALLKGRSNYVCHYHLERLQDDPQGLKARGEAYQLRQIAQFAQKSKTGDRAELQTVPEDADIWSRVTATRENCLGQECPHVKDCFVYKARRLAQEADIVVINHALFMADMALKEEGITDLLPQADIIIFDEAHQLPETATRFLGKQISTHQVVELARLIEVTGLAQAREAAPWSVLSQSIENATKVLRLSCAALEHMPSRRVTSEAIPDPVAFEQARSELDDALAKARTALISQQERHPDLAAALRSLDTIQTRLSQWGQSSVASTVVHWLELGLHHLRLHSAPLSVSDLFSKETEVEQARIFLSATLTVKGDFSHFTSRLGLEQAQTVRYESPFSYPDQALLYVPTGLPLPQAPDFLNQFVAALFPLIQAGEGATLVLCTTLRAVERVAQLLAEAYEAHQIEWPILRQGTQTRRFLLEKFRDTPHAVLVGSASFWEGIDVVGSQLTTVAIDKLPFAPPDDPVLEARLKVCRQEGGNPFMSFQLPEAAITLKQGAGRLIRSEQDWGVLMVGDTRLVEKPYGRLLWQGLPPFKRTRLLDDAVSFLSTKRQQAAQAKQSVETID
jgi:ATP-dependent DNA helicase DinG